MIVGGGPLPFSHGAKSWMNAIGDNAVYPLAHLDTPLTSQIMLAQSGYIGRFFPVKIFFMWKSELDWTPIQHNDNAIAPARLAVNDFIAKCESLVDENGDRIIDEIKDASELEFMNLFDVGTSGIILSISIKPRNYSSVCPS